MVTNVRRTASGVAPARESELEAQVEEFLRLTGWRVYHTRDSRRSEPGFPDIVAIRGKRMLVLELKTASGKVTPEQLDWLRAFAGVRQVESFVIRGTSDLGELVNGK